MADYLTTDTELTSIANAIRTKGGTSASLVYPAGFVSAIQDIPSGGGSYGNNDVIFWDGLANNGDGAIVYSCSASDFAAMTEFPANPDHSNYSTHGISIPMTSMGWNISLSDAKTFVSGKKFLVIGQHYKPTDGKTHIVCNIESASNNSVSVGIYNDNTANVEVDDTSIGEKTGAFVVDSLSVGWHDIKLTAVSTRCYLRRTAMPDATTQLYQANVREVHIGSSFVLWSYAFSWCINLKTISIPADLSNFGGSYVFYECHHLASITITKYGSPAGDYNYYNCYCLKYVSCALLVTNSYAFYNCYNLRQLCGLRNANTGNYPGNITGTYGVEKVSLDEYLERIVSNMFRDNYALKYIVCPRTSPPTLQSGAFTNVNPDFVVYVPTGSKATYDAATNWASISSHIVEADW